MQTRTRHKKQGRYEQLPDWVREGLDVIHSFSREGYPGVELAGAWVTAPRGTWQLRAAPGTREVTATRHGGYQQVSVAGEVFYARMGAEGGYVLHPVRLRSYGLRAVPRVPRRRPDAEVVQ